MTQFVTIAQDKGTREELEPSVLALANEGVAVYYLGVQGPQRGGDDPWPVHTWRIGEHENPVNPAYVPAPSVEKVTRVDKSAVYRPEVWMGSGQPVGPVDFSRPAPEEEDGPFPAPLVTAGQPWEGMVVPPKPIMDMARYADAAGWDHMITYAKGWVPHATHGRPSEKPKESWAVRMKRGEQRAVAVRMDAQWASLWTWAADSPFVHHKGLGEFKEAVR